MDVARLRLDFRDFLGPERFRRFVFQLNRRHRLRTWQEEIVAEFLATHPEYAPLGRTELLASFAICEVHGNELQSYLVPVRHGHVDYSRDYTQAWSSLFTNFKRKEIWSWN